MVLDRQLYYNQSVASNLMGKQCLHCPLWFVHFSVDPVFHHHKNLYKTHCSPTMSRRNRREAVVEALMAEVVVQIHRRWP
jgi:hypothetical protein